MHEINKVLSAAAWRLGVMNFIRGLVLALAIALGGLILLRIVQQLFGFALPWVEIGYWGAGAVVAAGLAWCVFARPGRLAVARRVDEGANLRESLSTALYIEKQTDDPWVRATIETAVQKARGVRVAQAVPIQPPRFWPVPLAMGLALGVLSFMPVIDVLGWRKETVAKEETRVQVVQAKQEALDAKKKVEDMVKDLDLAKEKVDPPEADKPEPRNPEEIRKSAIKELTKLNERLEQLRSGEKGQKLDKVENRLKQLKSPGKETSELTKAMAQGNFEQAKQEIEKLKEQMAGSEMSASEKQKVGEQLDKIAEQMSKMAENKKELEDQLSQAGLDKELAKDPEALKKALEKAQNLSDEQKDQLQQQAQSQSQCQSSMDSLSKCMSQMASACKNGDKQGMEQAAQGAQGQMSELEQLAEEMSQAEAAQNECKSQMAQMGSKCNGGECNGQGQGQQAGNGSTKPWSAGWNESFGNGRGGPGQGQGGSPGSQAADFSTEKRMAIGQLGPGPIIGSRLVEGDSIKGESHAALTSAITSAEQGATEAMENNTIPREYHEAIKNYFGNLKTKTNGKGAAAGSGAKDAAPAKPAEEPKK